MSHEEIIHEQQDHTGRHHPVGHPGPGRGRQRRPVAQPSGSEKCYGVSAAGKNDCAAGIHSCAGQSTKNFDKTSFVFLPKGACSKLAGGSMMAAK